jgi:membrane protein YdbS with pleckstrin-like domain
MSGALRIPATVVLLLVAAGCAYLAVAAGEAPRESAWAFRALYAVVGILSLFGAGWLQRPRQVRV